MGQRRSPSWEPDPSRTELDRGDFEHVVDRVLEDLPRWVIDSIDNLVVVVEDDPPPELAGSLGVYEGVSLAERSDYWGVAEDTDR